MNSENLYEYLKALEFAAKRHKNQRRKDRKRTPYINHPISVCYELAETGQVRDPAILKAAVLHDTLEDTPTEQEEIKEKFGIEVLNLVLELTDNKELPKKVRKALQIKHASVRSDAAKQIKLADKICNISDIVGNPPIDWNRRRKIEYLDWAEQVVNEMRGVNEKLENKFDEMIRTGREKLERKRSF